MAFALNLINKKISAVRLFVGKLSNSSIYNSGRAVALFFSFSLANPNSQPYWVLIASKVLKKNLQVFFNLVWSRLLNVYMLHSQFIF